MYTQFTLVSNTLVRSLFKYFFNYVRNEFNFKAFYVLYTAELVRNTDLILVLLLLLHFSETTCYTCQHSNFSLYVSCCTFAWLCDYQEHIQTLLVFATFQWFSARLNQSYQHANTERTVWERCLGVKFWHDRFSYMYFCELSL